MMPPRTATTVAILFGLAAGCAPAPSDVSPTPTGTGGASAATGTGGASAGSGGASGSGGAAGPAGNTGGANGSGGSGGAAGIPGGADGSGGAATGGRGGDGATTGGRSGGAGGAEGGTGGRGAAGGGSGGTPGGGGATGPGCPAGAFLCEGFEAHTVGEAPGGMWSRDARGGGQITVETAKPFAGQKALHVTGMMNTDRANVRAPMAIAANTIFVRFMMYTASYPSSAGVHTRLMRLGTNAGAPTGNPESCYSFSSYNGTAIEKVNSIYLRNTQTHLNDDAVKNRWVCWEFEIDKTGGVGKVAPHIWLDGKELALAAAGSATHGMTSPSWDPIPIETFIMGLDGFQADPVRADFWIDDLVIHSQRVGCPAR